MEVAVPWREWRRLLRSHDSEPSAVADAVRSFLITRTEYLSAREVLDVLWRVRCHEASDEVHDVVALMMIVTIEGREGRWMAMTLLDSVLEDAIEDLRGASKLATRWSIQEEAAQANTIAWGSVVEAAYCICRANALSAEASESLSILEDVMKGSGYVETFHTRETSRADSMTWDEFMEIPSGFERTPLGVSKMGREALQYIEEIVAQEKWCLQRQKDATEEIATVIKEIGALVEPIVSIWEQARKMDADKHILHVVDAKSEMILPRCSMRSRDEDKRTTMPASDLTEVNIESTMEELEAIEDVSILSIRVTSILGFRLRERKYSAFGDQAVQWERAIRKEINSLTSDSDSALSDRVSALLRHAAFHPTALIDSLLDSALSSTQHHNFIVRLISLCPILARWPSLQPTKEQFQNRLVCVRLHDGLLDSILASDGSEPIEKSPSFRFVVSLSGVGRGGTPVSGPVLTPSVVLTQIFMVLLKDNAITSDTHMLTRAYVLLYEFVKELQSAGIPVHSEVLEACLKLAIVSYLSSSTVDLQDILLIFIQRIHSNCIDPDVKELPTISDVRLRSLVESLPRDREYGAVGTDIQSLLRSFESQLWSLVWLCGVSEHEEVSRGLRQTLIQLQKHQCRLKSGTTTTGASVIETQVARMLGFSGGRVAERIMRAAETLFFEAGTLCPLTLSSTSETWDVPLEQPLWTMLFAIRCVGIAALAEAAPHFPSHAFEMAMSRVDKAIEFSRDNPTALLLCLRTVAFAFVTCERGNESQRMRVEIAAVRVLFLLKEQSSHLFPTTQQQNFRESVGMTLVTSTLLKSEAVRRFLQTHTDSYK